MTRAWLTPGFLFWAVSAVSQTPPLVNAPPSQAILLRGGAIHTISGPVIANGSVLIRDGKIVGVGRDLPAPEGAKVIDLAGQQVYPGMIDSASHIGTDEAGQPSDAAETGLLNPQLRSLSAVNSASEQIPAARFNGVTSAAILPEGDLISGQLSVIHMDGSAGAALAPSAAIHLRFPAIETRPIPPHEPLDDDDEPTTAVEEKRIPYAEAKARRDAELKTLNRFFDSARRYQKARSSRGSKQPVDLRMEAMLPVLDGTRPLFVTAVRAPEIREAIAFAARQKIRIVLADAYESYKVLDLIRAANIPVVLGPTMSLPLDRDDPYDRSFTTPADLYKAGIKFAIATFSARSVRNLPYQAAAAVPYGLPEDEAYKSVSLHAAEILGLSKGLGSIDEGKTADLIVTDGNPLEATTHVTQVFIDGAPVDLTTRQQRLRDKYQTRK